MYSGKLNLSPENVLRSHKDNFIEFARESSKMDDEWEIAEPEEIPVEIGTYDDWHDVYWPDDELGEWND